MLVFLSGGFDPVLTTDPKERSEAEPWVDIPYAQSAILNSGRIRLGPLFEPFARNGIRMSVLNGVKVNTANHHTGTLQFSRFRTGINDRAPTLLDILGARRDGQPIGSMTLGLLNSRDYSLDLFGGPRFIDPADGKRKVTALDQLDGTAPEDLERLGESFRRHAEALRRSGARDSQTASTIAHLDECAALVQRLPQIKPFRPEPWSKDPQQQAVAIDLQRALWAFENDLCAGVYLRDTIQAWDTHLFNLMRQKKEATRFMDMFVRFLTELDRRSNRFGKLSDSVAVVAGSEMGRYPGLNNEGGKDHFPECPFIFFGSAFSRGAASSATYGKTGRKMQAMKVSPKTGRDDAAGHPIVLDDIGKTLLQIAGVSDPTVYGYDGKTLEFLL